jgi:hypothetical protein
VQHAIVCREQRAGRQRAGASESIGRTVMSPTVTTTGRQVNDTSYSADRVTVGVHVRATVRTATQMPAAAARDRARTDC